jgi:hypothetical protein
VTFNEHAWGLIVLLQATGKVVFLPASPLCFTKLLPDNAVGIAMSATKKTTPNRLKPASIAHQKFAVVLSGGGARGAYEAGVMHFIRTQLPKKARQRRFDIYTGTSVGAIIACFMGSTAHDLAYQGEGIYQLWHNLTQADVYKRNLGELVSFIKGTSLGLAANLTLGVQKSGYHFHGLLNSAPLLPTLSRSIDFAQISKNIGDNHSGAIALVATNDSYYITSR